jgi:hypothetical protein
MKQIIGILAFVLTYGTAHTQNCDFPNAPSINERLVTHTKGVLADMIDINMEADFFDYENKARQMPMSKNVLGNSIVMVNQFESMEIMNTEVEWLMDFETFKTLKNIRSRKFKNIVNEFYTASLKVAKRNQQYVVRLKIYYPSENWLVWDINLELYQLKKGGLEKVYNKKQQYRAIRQDFLCIAATTLFN